MPSIESSPFAIDTPRHHPSSSGWFSSSREEKDPLLALKGRFAEYNERLASADKLATDHVYENPDLSLLDVRQHRLMLHYFLYQAEELAVDFLALQRSEETAPFIISLDEQIGRLLKLFQEWHGDPEADPGIPESFKQAMREAKAGQTAVMEDDLFAADAVSNL